MCNNNYLNIFIYLVFFVILYLLYSEAQSLESIVSNLSAFEEGESVYGKQHREKREREVTSPSSQTEETSPPEKYGKPSVSVRSIQRTYGKKNKLPKSSGGTSTGPLSSALDAGGITPRRSHRIITKEKKKQLSIRDTLDQPGLINHPDTQLGNQGPTIKTMNPQHLLHYSINLNTIEYIIGKSPMRPVDYTQTMKLWFQDKWNHLQDPPIELTNTIFLACIPPTLGNTERSEALMLASNNLEIARMTSRFKTRDPSLLSNDIHNWLPYPSVLASTSDPAKGKSSDILHDKFLKTVSELLDTVRVLQKDIDRNAFLFRSVCVDTAQGLREGGDRMIKEVRELTGLVASATTPISVISRDLGTDPMSPPTQAPL